jgi:hypothetical protein
MQSSYQHAFGGGGSMPVQNTQQSQNQNTSWGMGGMGGFSMTE